jgi:hypothetical protein
MQTTEVERSRPEKKIRITNTQPRLLHGPDAINTLKSEDGTARISGYGSGISLVPGGNNVPEAAWKAAKTNRTVQSWISLGWVTEGGDVSAPEGVPPPATLSVYNETTATAMVESEGDLVALRRWDDQEERPTVKAALKRKLDAITGDGKLRSK